MRCYRAGTIYVIQGRYSYVPYSRLGFRRARIGSVISHRLHGSVEFIEVNVGGSRGERCRPSMKLVSVGGVIVLRARESRVQGEGRQGIDVLKV